jgi:hypothetical protein
MPLENKPVENMSLPEKLMVSFVKKELSNNPQMVGKLLQHFLEQQNLPPQVVIDTVTLVEELIPVIMQQIKT